MYKGKISITLVFILIVVVNIKAQKIGSLATDGNNVYARSETGNLVSITNNGNSISEVNCPVYKDFGFELVVGGNIIVAIDNETIHITNDQAKTWKIATRIPEYMPTLTVSIDGTTIYAMGGANAFFSTDFGTSWTKIKSLNNQCITNFSTYGDKTYATGGNNYKKKSALLVSKDNKKTWEKIPNKIPTSITAFAAIGTTLFVGTNEGMWLYDETTETWSSLKFNGTEVNYFVHSLLLKGTSLFGIFSIDKKNKSVYKSIDNGKTWIPSGTGIVGTDGPAIVEGYQIETLLLVGSTLYCSITPGYKSAGGDLYLSENDGETWKNCQWQAELREKNAQSRSDYQARQKRINDSLKVISNQTETNNKTIKAYFKGLAEKSYKNYDVAIVSLSEAISLKPDFVEALKTRTDCYREMKEYEKAKVDSIALIKASASVTNAVFKQEFIKIEKQVNDLSDLLHVEFYYKDDKSWYIIGSNKCCDDGLSCLSKAIELNNTNADYFYQRGLNRERYYPDLAAADYTQAVKLNPKYEWYEAEKDWYYQCADCNGKGHKLVINVKQQEVNGKMNSESSSQQEDCKYCENGYFSKKVMVKSIRLAK